MNGTNGNQSGYPENALIPYPVIVAATNMITGNEVIENLQARLLSFILDIRKIARGDI